MSAGEFVKDNAAVLLLAGAAAGWYAASSAASEALAGGKLALRRRVFAQWIPIVTLALVATLAQQTSVALGVLLASSVAALSLVLGIVTIAHEFGRRPTEPGGFPVIETRGPVTIEKTPATDAQSSPAVARRVWAFVLPAAMILLLAGFTGRLNGMHALLLSIEGLAILTLWNARSEFDAIDAIDAIDASDAPPRRAARRAIEFALAILLALLASWAGVRATLDVSRQIGQVSGGFVSALLVAPALVLPMIGSGMTLARANLYSGAVSASVGIVLLNLCFGLPLVLGVWYAKPLWGARSERLVAMVTPSNGEPTTAPAPADDAGAVAPDPSMRFPIALWRVDTVVLILLGLVLLPLAVGRWMPGKFEGVLLVFVYVIYMGLTTWVARA